MAKIIKKPKKTSENNVIKELRRLGVVVEGMDDKIGLVAEQYAGIKKEVDEIKTTLDVNTEMIAKLAINAEIIKNDAEIIKHSLKRKVDIEEFAALEKRVSFLEKRL